MPDIPLAHPPIPADIRANDVMAIVTVHDPQAHDANKDSPFRVTPFSVQRAGPTTRGSVDGCQIFLHQVTGQPCYTLGRKDNKKSSGQMPQPQKQDVYLPSSQVGINHLCLMPIWETNVWRLQSTSEIIATVNDVPIQMATPRTKKLAQPLPSALHLRQDVVNQTAINNLWLDIWVLRTVREAHPFQIFVPLPLHENLQRVTNRSEPWAHDRYFLMDDQVSANSYRVVERFTGKIQTVKLFRNKQRGRELRDAELARFKQNKGDISIVRYLQSAEVDGIPATITETHEGYTSYAALRSEIHKQHPSYRFSIASKLLRRLFSALNFLHFHGIIHGNVTNESVLLHVADHKTASVLLVNYSHSSSFTSGMKAPHQKMLEDGRDAMQVVEDACDIWQLRKAASENAISECFMAQKTTTAQQDHETMERVVSDFFQVKGGSRTSEKGKKLLRLLEKKLINWESCKADQLHNARRREVGMCFDYNVIDMVQDWRRTHPNPTIGETPHMLLSLGHPWFDHLSSLLHHNSWDLTPSTVCAKFKELAGDDEEPWQEVEVRKVVYFPFDTNGFQEKPILEWLASYCEIYPEWRDAVQSQFKQLIEANAGIISHRDIMNLQSALLAYGDVPKPMTDAFAIMSVDAHVGGIVCVEQTHMISLHVPSRLFNLTQLQRVAPVDWFVHCVSNGDIRCDNFVEVRGEPKLEGCCAPLSLLSAFAVQLGLTLPSDPDNTQDFPSYDPSDFSQVSSDRIILARKGLVAFASLLRVGDQYDFHAPLRQSESRGRDTFLPTYFGDMKVLPALSKGGEYARPEHWSKFKTADELYAAADVGKRKVLKPKKPLAKVARNTGKFGKAGPSNLTAVMDMDESDLKKIIRQREQLRSKALPPTKRNSDTQASETENPAAKRAHPSLLATADLSSAPKAPNVTLDFARRAAEQMEQMARNHRVGPLDSTQQAPKELRASNMSFFERHDGVNLNLLVNPRSTALDIKRSFTVASGASFDLKADWEKAKEWLKQMPEKEVEAPKLEGIFGFCIHHSLLGEGSDTEEDEESSETPAQPGNKPSGVKSSASFSAIDSTSSMLNGKGKAPMSSSFSFRSQTWPQPLTPVSYTSPWQLPQPNPSAPMVPALEPTNLLNIFDWLRGHQNTQNGDSEMADTGDGEDMPDTDGESDMGDHNVEAVFIDPKGLITLPGMSSPEDMTDRDGDSTMPDMDDGL